MIAMPCLSLRPISTTVPCCMHSLRLRLQASAVSLHQGCAVQHCVPVASCKLWKGGVSKALACRPLPALPPVGANSLRVRPGVLQRALWG